MTHTPGPWKVLAGTIIESENRPQYIAKVPAAQIKTFYEDRANARLIAAAPQLLEALEHIQTWYESNATDDDCPICRYEPPHHHGQCPKELAEQALAAAGGNDD